MVKIRYLVLSLMFVLSGADLTLSAKTINGKSFTVVIDPGHGGHDSGAAYQRIKEKDIVLNLAVKLGRYINQEMPDIKIVYTRKTDVFIPLHERADKAIASKADLFISIHANSCATPSVSGTETFVLGMHRTNENLEVAKKENSVILIEEDYSTRYEGFDPNSSESYIMFDLVQEEYFDQSVSIAALVQNNFKFQAQRKDRGVKQAGFWVLRQTSMPSILIEAGYLSNPHEASYLNSDNGQNNLAKAICEAVKSYKKTHEIRTDFDLRKQATTGSSDTKPETAQFPNQSHGSAPITIAKRPKEIPIRENRSQNEIYYSIQIAATRRKIETGSKNFKGLNAIYMLQIDGIYKYYYGKENSYEEIIKRKDEIQNHYADAFVIAFRDGKPIAVQEARELQMK